MFPLMNFRIWFFLVICTRLRAKDLIRDQDVETSFISTSNKVVDGSLTEIFSNLLSESQSGNIEIRDRETADQTLPFSPFEQCELVGFEFKKGVECGEVVEFECGPVNVTKTRYELVNKCKTHIEHKCGVNNREVPQQECFQRIKNSCQTSYHIIQEEVYTEECTVQFVDLCEPHGSAAPDLPGPYSVVQFREKRDVSTQAIPGYSYPAKERPAPTECQQIAQSCHHIPRLVAKKVPHTVCLPVPTQHCGFVLRTVPEVECGPFPVEECKDVAKDIPYIVAEQQCEEVVYDECQEVETRLPVELCKRKRFGENTIFLSRGEVVRKLGDKSRRKIFQRQSTGKVSGQLSGNSTQPKASEQKRTNKVQQDL